MIYQIGKVVKVIYTDRDKTFHHYGIISGIKSYSEGKIYYVADGRYYDYQIEIPSNEELGTIL